MIGPLPFGVSLVLCRVAASKPKALGMASPQEAEDHRQAALGDATRRTWTNCVRDDSRAMGPNAKGKQTKWAQTELRW